MFIVYDFNQLQFPIRMHYQIIRGLQIKRIDWYQVQMYHMARKKAL